MRLTVIDWIAIVLVIVGALNWGLVGLFNYNLVAGIFAFSGTLLRIVYVLVGLAGLWLIYLFARFSSEPTTTSSLR